MLSPEVAELKTTIGFIVGFQQQVKVGVEEAEKVPENEHETIAVSSFGGKKLTEKVFSQTEEMSPVRVQRASLCADMNKMATLVSRMNEDVELPLPNVCVVAKKMNDELVDILEQKIQEHLVDR